MEKTFIREASQKNASKEKLVTPIQRDDLILEAALEWGADCIYDISFGTLGETLYIDAPNKLEASYIRQQVPCYWHGLYVVVRYTSSPEIPAPTPNLTIFEPLYATGSIEE